MKLVTYSTGKEARLGALRDDSIIDLANASQGQLPSDMLTFLQGGDAAIEAAKAAIKGAAPACALKEPGCWRYHQP